MMGRQVFDRFPPSLRLGGFLICGLIGAAIAVLVPDDRALSLIFFIPALVMLGWCNVLALQFDGRSWTYRRGLWPVVLKSSGSFSDLNAIEIGVHLYQPADQSGNTIDDSAASNSYTAYLSFKNGSMRNHPLLSGRSFGAAAKPATILAHRMGIPITLAPSARGYDTQLSEYIERASEH